MTISRVYTRTAGDIIEEALRDAKIIPAEQPVSAVDYANGLVSLNNVSKDWDTDGIHFWLQKRVVLPLNQGQQVYLLGPDGDPCGFDDEFVSTEIDTAANAGDVTLIVDSTFGMEAAPDILSFDPTDSTQDWTTGNTASLSISSGLRVTNGAASAGYATYELETEIGVTYRVRVSYTLGTSVSAVLSVLNGVTVADTITLTASGDAELVITAATDVITFKVANSSSTLGQYSTINDLQYVNEASGSVFGVNLDDGNTFWSYVLDVNSDTSVTIRDALPEDGASGSQVYSFLEQIPRPLQLFNVTYLPNIGVAEVPVVRWSRQEYTQQPDKSAQGNVVNWNYVPYLGEGKLYVWQTASSSLNVMKFDIRVPLAVYSETSDELDYPSEYYMALKWAIAADLGPSYGVADSRQATLEQKAEKYFQKALGNDNEFDSMMIGPDYNGGW